MHTISTSDVKKLAQLSALSLSDDELTAMQTDLSHILSYVAQLDAVDTTDVEPTYYVHNLDTVTRSDEIINYGVSQVELLENAPNQKDSTIVVPRVLE